MTSDSPEEHRRLRRLRRRVGSSSSEEGPADETARSAEDETVDEDEATRAISSSGPPSESPSDEVDDVGPEDVEAEVAAADVMLEADDEAEGEPSAADLVDSSEDEVVEHEALEPEAADRDEEPEGEAGDEEPEGEAEAPEDEAEAPEGEAEAPEGEAEAPEGEAEAPAEGRARRRRRRRRGGSEPAAPPAPAPRRRRSQRDPNLPPPVVRAQAKYVRSSARKARLVCDQIRGRTVDEARAILALTPRAVARDWSKLLESAVANAEHNHELVGEDLYVKAVHADEGPTIKRFRPRAMGRATRIRKRTSHLTILLTPKE